MDRLALMRLEKDLRDLSIKWRDGEVPCPENWCAACEMTPPERDGNRCSADLASVIQRHFGAPKEAA